MSEDTAYNRAIWMIHNLRAELDKAYGCIMMGKDIEGGIHLEATRYKARDYEIELQERKRSALSDEEEVSE